MAQQKYIIQDPNLWKQIQPYLPPPDPNKAYLGGSPYWDPQYGWAISHEIFQKLPTHIQQLIIGKPITSPPPPIPVSPPPGTGGPRPVLPTTPQPSYPQPSYRGSYTPDIDYLRSQMPSGIPQGLRMYTDIARTLGQYLLQPQQAVTTPYIKALEILARQQHQVGASPTLAQIGQQLRGDIEYLRTEPGQFGFEQAYRTSAYENIDKIYDTARQRILQEYARRGIEPSSGIVQDQLRKVEEARASDRAKAERDLAMWKIQEQRSRLAEARQVANALAQLEATQRAEERALATMQPELARTVEDWATARALRALPILHQIPQAAIVLDQIERSRRAEARAIEQMLEDIERQRIFDMLALMQGTAPSPAGAAVVGPWAQHTSSLAALLGQQAAQAWGGLGALLGQLFGGWQQPTTQPSLWMQPVQTPIRYG